jgi:predicted HTH transcriptional regulator
MLKTLKTAEEIKRFKRIGEGGKRQIYIDFVKVINQHNPQFGKDVIERIENEELENIQKELLDNGEHYKLEAKESFFVNSKLLKIEPEKGPQKNSDDAIRGIIKTVVAFTNGLGGRIVVGINDPKFELVGIDNTDLRFYQNWDKLKQAMSQKILNETDNIVKAPEIKKLSHDGKTFALIKVAGLDRQRFEEQELASLKDGSCYKRENADSVMIKPTEIRKYCHAVLKEIDSDDDVEE